MTTITESSELLASTDASVVVDEDDDKVMNDILQAFYEGDKYKDIIFIVAKQEIPANAIIVKVRSPVLKTILENPTRNSTGKIALDDQNLEDFKKFIKFLYTNDCDITGENVIGLFLLGKKYNVPALSEKCLNYFENHLTKDNAPTYMAKTLMNPDLSEFSEKCLKVAPSATGVISVTNFFILDKYDKPTVVFLAEWILQILQQDRPDDYEEILFAKIFEWAKVYCRYHGLQEDSTNIKEAMKDLIPYIRFENLKYSTLAKIVRPNSLISVEELLSYFCNKPTKEHEKQSNGKVADT